MHFKWYLPQRHWGHTRGLPPYQIPLSDWSFLFLPTTAALRTHQRFPSLPNSVLQLVLSINTYHSRIEGTPEVSFLVNQWKSHPCNFVFLQRSHNRWIARPQIPTFHRTEFVSLWRFYDYQIAQGITGEQSESLIHKKMLWRFAGVKRVESELIIFCICWRFM